MILTFLSIQMTHSALWKVSMTEGAEGWSVSSSGGALGTESSRWEGGAVAGRLAPLWRIASCSAHNSSWLRMYSLSTPS